MKNKWTHELKRVRASSAGEKSSAFRTFIDTECGPSLTVREARSRLFFLTTSALAGRPRLIEVDGADTILISLADLEGILLDLSFAKFVEGLKELPRRKMRKR
ncbi:hypothetical protein [Rhizobium phaseoli]|uniref:hypothetical protein n=1 Tax=Rhizobium phaseoli TaxID=396 RepID=UPI0007F070AA|nr:hypothetical protein [Rhizobium phaseoli]ANL33933.1 hypothetical protein AMC89_CH01860 [Rhizobium phaseoli]ANL97658.1 hypothetical protein AMC79_CH01855 [Rhizobium phaseoli]